MRRTTLLLGPKNFDGPISRKPGEKPLSLTLKIWNRTYCTFFSCFPISIPFFSPFLFFPSLFLRTPLLYEFFFFLYSFFFFCFSLLLFLISFFSFSLYEFFSFPFVLLFPFSFPFRFPFSLPISHLIFLLEVLLLFGALLTV